MRLIDADKILQETWKVETKDMFHMTEIVDVVSAIDIERAPTVEAIPIEFIEAFKKEVRDVANGKAVIEWLLEEWEKENGRSE